MTVKVQPLSGPPPTEVPLTRAPLVRVIAQVRFASILAIRSPDRVAPFQEAIRSAYPNLTEDRVPHISLNAAAGGMPAFSESVIWRFSSSTTSLKWRVSLGVDFVSLETSAYVSRKDFMGRLELVLSTLQKVFGPSEAQRLGLRYVDRIVDDGLERINSLIKPNVLGISTSGSDAQSPLHMAVQYLLTEAHLKAEEGAIQARWGHMPPKRTYDPQSLEPLDKPSWVLDLDMVTTDPQPFESADLLHLTTKFAERNYSVFREMVTEEFLRFYGGKP